MDKIVAVRDVIDGLGGADGSGVHSGGYPHPADLRRHPDRERRGATFPESQLPGGRSLRRAGRAASDVRATWSLRREKGVLSAHGRNLWRFLDLCPVACGVDLNAKPPDLNGITGAEVGESKVALLPDELAQAGGDRVKVSGRRLSWRVRLAHRVKVTIRHASTSRRSIGSARQDWPWPSAMSDEVKLVVMMTGKPRPWRRSRIWKNMPWQWFSRA